MTPSTDPRQARRWLSKIASNAAASRRLSASHGRNISIFKSNGRRRTGGRKARIDAPYKTTFAKVAVAIDGAPASTCKVAVILSHPEGKPWESHRLQLQLPAPVPASLLPLRTRRVRRQK